MKKVIYIAGIVAAGLVLAACNKLTQYTITEQDMNQYLQKYNNFQKQIGISGLVDADITVDQLNSQIGRTDPNKVTLTGHAKVNISSILGPQTSDLQITLQAQPVYNSEQGAIFLRDMELTDYTVKPEKMSGVMKAVVPYLNQSLKTCFNEKAVYTLDPNKSEKEALAKKLAKGIEVKPGEIIIPFTD
ncbi:lipoprotein [Hafnia alvei]